MNLLGKLCGTVFEFLDLFSFAIDRFFYRCIDGLFVRPEERKKMALIFKVAGGIMCPALRFLCLNPLGAHQLAYCLFSMHHMCTYEGMCARFTSRLQVLCVWRLYLQCKILTFYFVMSFSSQPASPRYTDKKFKLYNYFSPVETNPQTPRQRNPSRN